jgi:hypothetical protein
MVEKCRNSNAHFGTEHLGDISRVTDQREETTTPVYHRIDSQHTSSLLPTVTSKASFVDADEIPVYGEKPMEWKPSGRRIKRGLYRAGNEWRINADCNGAANIIRKVATMLGLDLSGVSRGALTAPSRIPLWN